MSCPVKFVSIKIIPHFSPTATGGFDVYWHINGYTFSPTFMVQWSETESGPWTNAFDTPTANYFALNLTPEILNLQAIRWFRILVYNASTLVVTSPPVDHRNRLSKSNYLFYKEHLRRLRLTLSKTGAPGWLIRRRLSGAQCPVCCHEILATPVTQECSTCYGTRFTGGYWPVVKMLADWGKEGPPSNANTKETPAGPIQVVHSNILLFPIPDAKTGDLWADVGTRYLFEVVSSDAVPFMGVSMNQIVTITRLPPHHPAYNFPLPLSFEPTIIGTPHGDAIDFGGGRQIGF